MNMQGGPINPSAMFRHTTDINNTNGQSVLERGDLDELMAMVGMGVAKMEFEHKLDASICRCMTWAPTRGTDL